MRLLDQQVLAAPPIRVAMRSEVAMGIPKLQVVVVVRAVWVLLRQVQSVVMAELEFQVR
jgi:hypothetical protein